jgi:hypothetical protein
MEPKIKLTNLWLNYQEFLDAVSLINFEIYSVLKNWPSVIVEKSNGWKDFIYTVLLNFKETAFAECFDGYTAEEIAAIQWAISNKYEAIEAKMLSELQGQVFMGVQFGIGYSQETKPAGSGPSPYAGQPARTMKSVPRKGVLGNIGKYVRDYKEGDEDVMMIDGQMWIIGWIKQKNWDFTDNVTYALRLKNYKTGEFMVFPNAVTMAASSDSGYSRSSSVTVWYPSFFSYGSMSRGSDQRDSKPPYMNDKYKAYFDKKFKTGELSFDKYPKGTLNSKMAANSGI